MTLQEIKRTYEGRKGQAELLQSQIDDQTTKLRALNKRIRYAEQAQHIIQVVAQNTQKELEYHISDIVSLALASVFNNPYELGVEFVIRRNKTEADIYFVRGTDRVHPISASGGGAVDVASFALRVALWSLMRPKKAEVLVLDEPFKWLSVDLQEKASQMMQEISKKIGLQILMVSHVQDLIENSDKVFRIRNGEVI